MSGNLYLLVHLLSLFQICYKFAAITGILFKSGILSCCFSDYSNRYQCLCFEQATLLKSSYSSNGFNWFFVAFLKDNYLKIQKLFYLNSIGSESKSCLLAPIFVSTKWQHILYIWTIVNNIQSDKKSWWIFAQVH